MGHERLGILPKTKPWLRIVEELTSSDLPEEKVKAAASLTRPVDYLLSNNPTIPRRDHTIFV